MIQKVSRCLVGAILLSACGLKTAQLYASGNPNWPWGWMSRQKGRSVDLLRGRMFSLNNDYVLHLEQLQIGGALLAETQLASAGSGDPDFVLDPAKPPAGYTLCHNGHCHADDGRLVAYEDVEAEIQAGGGGAVSFAAVVAMLLPQTSLSAQLQSIRTCEGCGLDDGTIARIRLQADVTMRLRVEDTRDPPRTEPWTAEMEATGLQWVKYVNESINLEEPPVWNPQLQWTVPDRLWDDVRWAQYAAEATGASWLQQEMVERLAQLEMAWLDE